MNISKGALVGRLLGTVGKLMVGSVMVVYVTFESLGEANGVRHGHGADATRPLSRLGAHLDVAAHPGLVVVEDRPIG